VNIDKREYLHPHKFGAGLKLVEFSGQGNSIMQGLAILLAHSNDRGGGDLRCSEKNIPEELTSLVGSWAGDRIVVAGDYDDDWLFVPEDLKGKVTTWEEKDEDTGEVKECKEIFGKRKNAAGEWEDYGETLYSAASQFFKDISNDVIKLIALAESPYHPFACVDLNDDGWQDIPKVGSLPKRPPKNPIAGKEAYEKYVKWCNKQ
jgi:hypothetical protein